MLIYLNMKINIIIVLLVCCSFQPVFSQERLSLSLKVDTQKTVNETEHFYLMEITNNANTSLQFKISIDNTKCQNISSSKQVLLNQSTLKKNKSQVLNQISIEPETSIEFYIKISRPNNTQLDTWNCSEVKAISKTGESLSNSVIIKSLIPDPKKFN